MVSSLVCEDGCAFPDFFISPRHSFMALSEKLDDVKKYLLECMIAAPSLLIDNGFEETVNVVLKIHV